MKREQKTYGIHDLVEWITNIVMGAVSFRVHFTGGAVTTAGTTPATYTTSDPIVQMAIERSSEFKSGRIKLLRSYDTGKEVAVLRNAVRTQPQEKIAEDAESDTREALAFEDAEITEDATLRRIEVANADDARNWLRDNCGIPTGKLRNKEIIASTAANCGVEFIYTK